MRKSRNASSYRRKKKYIRPSPFFIIVCEGKVTEVDYFKEFPYYCRLGGGPDGEYQYRYAAVYIEAAAGQHGKVVERACEVYAELINKYGTVYPDEVWCVFDRMEILTGLIVRFWRQSQISLMQFIQFNVLSYGTCCIFKWLQGLFSKRV